MPCGTSFEGVLSGFAFVARCRKSRFFVSRAIGISLCCRSFGGSAIFRMHFQSLEMLFLCAWEVAAERGVSIGLVF